MTRRQTEVIELVASGLVDKEIARRLGVTHRTVRTHLERLAGPTRRRRVALVAAWLLGEATDEQRARVRARLAGEVV